MAITWVSLETAEQLQALITASESKACLIFKHSTTCNISAMAKSRLEKKWDFPESEMQAYYLDLLRFRSLSNAVAEQLSVYHESPQVLLIRQGECIYDASHLDISVEELHEVI